MEQILTEIIKEGSSKLFNIFTPAIIEGLVINPKKEPLPNIVVHIGGEKTTTKMSGKFFIKIKRGIYDIGIEYHGKRFDEVEGIHVGGGEKVSATITIPQFIIDSASNAVEPPKEIDTKPTPDGKPDVVPKEEPDGASNAVEPPKEIDTKPTPDGKPDVDTEEPETYGPTRFAKKYIQKQPPELQTIIYAIIKGLSSSVTYHSNREATEHLELRQSKAPDWNVWIVSRPRKKIIEIIFWAEAGETITDDGSETYADKLAEFKCPQLAEKYPSWGDYLNCQLKLDSNEDEIESVRSAINWFLLESYK